MAESESALSRTALFVIDIQNDLVTDPGTKIPHADRVLAAGASVLHAARVAAAYSGDSENSRTTPDPLVVFVQHEEAPESGPLVWGSKAWELVFSPLTGCPEREIVVSKTARDTFESNPDLADQLKRRGISEIVAFGIQSECCVLSTCRGALAAGFAVTLLSGAHSTYDSGELSAQELEQQVEELLRVQGAKVVGWEDAIKKWELGAVLGPFFPASPGGR